MTDTRPRGLLHLAFSWIRVVQTLITELLKATWDTLRAVYAPRGSVRPAILRVPLDEKSPLGITVFANMITLTPGTTTLDVSDDQKALYVHALDAPDPDAVIAGLKTSLETRVQEVLP